LGNYYDVTAEGGVAFWDEEYVEVDHTLLALKQPLDTCSTVIAYKMQACGGTP